MSVSDLCLRVFSETPRLPPRIPTARPQPPRPTPCLGLLPAPLSFQCLSLPDASSPRAMGPEVRVGGANAPWIRWNLSEEWSRIFFFRVRRRNPSGSRGPFERGCWGPLIHWNGCLSCRGGAYNIGRPSPHQVVIISRSNKLIVEGLRLTSTTRSVARFVTVPVEE